MRPHADALASIRRHKWPKNDDGTMSARGELYDSGGNRLTDEPLKAHRKGEGPYRPDLREPWASDPAMTTSWHVEGDAAAIIRDRGLSGGVLYLNMPPCGAKSYDPKRCYANVEKILPKDSTLVVWVSREHGLPQRFVFKGTGEGVNDD